jgi:hypothetical protein
LFARPDGAIKKDGPKLMTGHADPSGEHLPYIPLRPASRNSCFPIHPPS